MGAVECSRTTQQAQSRKQAGATGGLRKSKSGVAISSYVCVTAWSGTVPAAHPSFVKSIKLPIINKPRRAQLAAPISGDDDAVRGRRRMEALVTAKLDGSPITRREYTAPTPTTACAKLTCLRCGTAIFNSYVSGGGCWETGPCRRLDRDGVTHTTSAKPCQRVRASNIEPSGGILEICSVGWIAGVVPWGELDAAEISLLIQRPREDLVLIPATHVVVNCDDQNSDVDLKNHMLVEALEKVGAIKTSSGRRRVGPSTPEQESRQTTTTRRKKIYVWREVHPDDDRNDRPALLARRVSRSVTADMSSEP